MQEEEEGHPDVYDDYYYYDYYHYYCYDDYSSWYSWWYASYWSADEKEGVKDDWIANAPARRD